MQNLLNTPLKNNEEELVCQARQGDILSFAELIRRNQASCRKLAVSILRDEYEAEDQVQEAFWKAFEHLEQFQGVASFSTWLHRIVANQCLTRLRQLKRLPAISLQENTDRMSDIQQMSEQYLNPEEQFGQQEVAIVLRREIGGIPPLLRNVFVLSDIKQLPMLEVAKRLDISVAAAKSRLLRSRLELRVRLAKHKTSRGLAGLLA